MANRTRWIVGVGLLVALLVGPGLIEQARLSLRKHSLERKLAELSEKQKRLVAERERLKNDPVYLEGLIRTTFKRALPGEYVIPIDDNNE